MSTGVNIVNNHMNTLVTGTDSDDFIDSLAETKVTIQALGGNDELINHGTYGSIAGGDGNDSITNTGHFSTIDGGGGNDSIVNDGRYASINPGTGDDYISTTRDGETIHYALGDGNDTIVGEIQYSGRMNYTLQITGAPYTSILSNSDVIIGVGENSIRLVGAISAKNLAIDGTLSSGSLGDENPSGKIIRGGNSADYISSDRISNGDTVQALGGNDTVISDANNVVLDGGTGSDLITSNGKNSSLGGGSGNDTIIGNVNNTINGGRGNDKITLNSAQALIQYSAGDGNDLITGFNKNSTLSISGAGYSTVASGNDVIVSVGLGKITLEGANTLDDDILLISPNPSADTGNSTDTGGTGDDSVQALLVHLDEMILKRTEAGYPVIAGLVFSPDEYIGTEPTNYTSKENWSITSKDGLKLSGIHYTPENSNDKWAVIVHGYGNNHEHMYSFAEMYLANGYNVLLIDQRAAGDSEGTWLTMGAAESSDLALWTQEIARRNSDAKITLFGVSMGAATAILAAARSDIKNVTSLVDDCGYTNMVDVVTLLQENNAVVNSLLPAPLIPALDNTAASLTGYKLSQADPIDSISAAKLPTLFIAGTNDTVVPMTMLSSLYEASGATVKEEFIVDGATHALAAAVDPVGYSNTMFRFIAEADGEGWLTNNTTSAISLRGTKYADTITTSGNRVTVNTGMGDDTINNSGSRVTFIYEAGDGNDLITGFGSTSTLSVTGGVYNSVTSGDDVIISVGGIGGKVTLAGAADLSKLNIRGTFSEGLDILNITDDTLITGTAYNDTIENLAQRVTVNGLGGNDYIVNNIDSSVTVASEVGNLIDAGDGKDTVFSYHSYYPTIYGGNGNDSIVIRRGHRTFIDAGDGNDSIIGWTTDIEDPDDWALGGYATLLGGAGNDYIAPYYTNNSTIDGGAGNDTIIMMGADSTITGGTGNDRINLGTADSVNVLINYIEGDGNDLITGFNENDTLSITGSNYNSVKSGDDVILTVGNGKITLAGSASVNALNIIGTSGGGFDITNTDDHTIVTGTAYDDTIYNMGSRVTIRGLAGDDFIVSNIDSTVTTESLVGNLIEAGDGNDTVYNHHSYHPTIRGGNGDDYLVVTYGHTIFIDGGNGNDTIGAATLPGAGDWAMGGYATLLGGDGNDYIDTGYTNNSTISGGTGNDTLVVLSADSTLDGGTGDDRISLSTADSVNAMINYVNGDGNDLITGFNENDTLNISGAQYASVKNGSDIILLVGDGKLTLKGASTLDTINLIGSYDEASDSIISNTSNRVSVTGTTGNDTITNSGSYDTIQGLAGNDSITNTGSNGLIFGDAGNDVIRSSGSNTFIYGGAGNDSLYASGSGVTVSGGEGSNYVSLEGSHGLYVMLEGRTTVDGFLTGFGSSSDTVFVTGDPSVDFKGGGLTFYEGSDSLTIHNVTDTAKVNLYYATTNRTRKGIFIPDSAWYTVADSDFSLGSNEGLYFVGTSANMTHGVDFSNISRALDVTLNTDYDASPAFWINNVHSIIGGAGSTKITGSNLNDTIIAGRGSTTINAGAGDDRISVTSAARSYLNYASGDGNDLITGFNANSTLNISGASYFSLVSGNNVLLSVGNSQLTLAGAADLANLNIIGTEVDGSTVYGDTYVGGDVTISDYVGEPIYFYDDFITSAFSNGSFLVQSSTGILTVENVTDKIVDLRNGSGNVFIKAYTPSTAGLIDGRGVSGFEIIQGSMYGTDVIFAGSGGSSLWGGAGDIADALVGGSDTDIFVVGRAQGNDNIFNASSTDLVNIMNASLSDIVATLGTDNGIAIGFNTGNVVNIQSTDTLSAAITLADNSTWRYNHVTKTWQNA